MGKHRQGQDEFRLLVVESRRLLRECLVARFEETGVWVRGADWVDAPAVARRSKPTVVLVSARWPNRRAAELAADIRRRPSHSRLVLLDEFPRPAVLAAALELPADGYWSQASSFDELLNAVGWAADGHWVCCPIVADCLQQDEHGPHFVGWPDGEPMATLSPRERQTLKLLAMGLSVKEIARRLNLAANTVDNHRAHMMQKLGLHKAADAVRLAIREGLVEG